MENASKALLMAGGILIAIIIIALLVRTFSTMSQFQTSRLSEEEQQKLVAFNEQYTKYLNQYVYGTDVLTLMNRYDQTGEVEVKLTDGSVKPERYENHYKYNAIDLSYSSDTRYYKCIEITYDDSTGKVNSITFDQIEVSADAGV